MNTSPQGATSSKTSPKDFFLWFGAIIALYGSVTSFIALSFEYVHHAFPDPLAGYTDPYGGAVRFSMAALIVLVPTTIILFRIIRGTIAGEEGKSLIWVRRWALVLTLFIATITILVDLITLINYFLDGEISIRFGLKVAIVLLVALGVFLHFLADMRGYWVANPKKANIVGIAVGILALLSVVFGFFIIGTPGQARLMRFDEQKVSDLSGIQSQVVYYFQQKQALPKELSTLSDPLIGYTLPVDAQTTASYRYEVTGQYSFKLCATFNAPTPATDARAGALPKSDVQENWQHQAGETCFARTIDPERYPATPTQLKR